jgi:hypothetical protein
MPQISEQLNLYSKEKIGVFDEDFLVKAIKERINERQEGHLKNTKIGKKLSSGFLIGVIETYNDLAEGSVSSSSPALLREVLEFIIDPKNADRFTIEYDGKIIRKVRETIDEFEQGNKAEGMGKTHKVKKEGTWGAEAALPPDDR